MLEMPSPNYEPVAVLVDPYRSGAWLASCFLSHGVSCVLVRSSLKTPFRGGNGGPYRASFLMNEGIDALISKLRAFRVIAAVPGSEQGVELSDQINAALNTNFANDIALSEARRDKFLMRTQIDGCGVAQPKYNLVRRREDVRAAVASIGTSLVVKPLRGAGTHGIRVHQRLETAEEHALELLGAKDFFGDQIDSVLLEQFIEGSVLILNSVSIGGTHALTDAWTCEKEISSVGNIAFSYMDYLQPGDSFTEAAWSFGRNVLDALGIRNGPAHTEVLWDGKSFWLVELAARLHGNLDPSMTLRLTGSNQILSTAKAYASGSVAGVCATRSQGIHCRAADLIVRRSGLLGQDLDLEPVKSLRSFWSARVTAKRGDTVAATTDLLSSPGSIVLCHRHRAVVEADYKALRNWERREYQRVLLPL